MADRAWQPYIWLFLISGLAAALRFFRLGEWSFWIDEIHTINHATRHFATLADLTQNVPPAKNWTPLSVIVTAQVLNVWGINEWSARFVAALVGTLSVPILYFPLRSMFNTRVALVAVLLLAVSPWHLEWSQNARGYTTLMLLATLALAALHFAIERDRPRYLLVFYLFLYLATSERMVALMIVPVVMAYLLALRFFAFEKPVGLRMRNVLLLAAPAGLFGLFQAYDFLRGRESIVASIVDEIVTTFVGNPIESPATQTVFMAFQIGVPLLAFALCSGVYVWRQKNRAGSLLFLTAVIPMVIVVALSTFMFVEERYAFTALPGWLVLVALGIDELLALSRPREAVLAVGVLAAFLGYSAGAGLLYYHVNHGHRHNWKEAFSKVAENLEPDDIVVSTWPELGRYYLNRDVVLWQDLDREQVSKGHSRIWFVVIPDMAWYTGTQDLLWWIERHTRMVKTLYLRTVDNMNLEIYVYDPSLRSVMPPLK